MDNEALQKLIQDWVPDLSFSQEGSQFLNVTVPAASLHKLMEALKTTKETQFDYLFCVTGVDWESSLGVIYHLESTQLRHRLVVRVSTEDRETPNFDTVSDLWATAEFHEREIFDFFGITFNHHPNLKNLFLTPEGWNGYPLRKDYEDEINMVIK